MLHDGAFQYNIMLFIIHAGAKIVLRETKPKHPQVAKKKSQEPRKPLLPPGQTNLQPRRKPDDNDYDDVLNTSPGSIAVSSSVEHYASTDLTANRPELQRPVTTSEKRAQGLQEPDRLHHSESAPGTPCMSDKRHLGKYVCLKSICNL